MLRKIFHFCKKILAICIYTPIVKKSAGVYDTINVNGYSRVTKNTFLGKNVNFNGLKVLGQGSVRIGDNFHSGTGVMIITDVHNYKGKALPYDDTYLVKDVVIEDNVWVGSSVIVLGGVRIGEGAIIQAGSVVTKNIPKLAIAGGHPATVFSERDKNHYYKLKDAGSFH